MYDQRGKVKKQKKFLDIYKDEYMRENRSFISKLLFTYIKPLLNASQQEEITTEHYGKLPERLSMDKNADILENNMKHFAEKYPNS